MAMADRERAREREIRKRPAALAAVVVALVCAGNASAWSSHSLNAQAGAINDSSTDVNDSSVDALEQIGIPGVDDYSYFAHAAANSDSGVLLAESSIDNGEGATKYSAVTIAGIEQWLQLVDGGGPVTVEFLLDLDLSAQSTGTAAARAAGRLDVGSLCGLYVQVSPGEDPELVDNCSDDYPYIDFETSIGAGALQVTATYAAGHVPSTIDFLAQVENEITLYSATALAQAFASGGLAISVSGASAYSFTSPTFLTLPEPRDAALGLAALGALAVCARRGATAPK